MFILFNRAAFIAGVRTNFSGDAGRICRLRGVMATSVSELVLTVFFMCSMNNNKAMETSCTDESIWLSCDSDSRVTSVRSDSVLLAVELLEMVADMEASLWEDTEDNDDDETRSLEAADDEEDDEEEPGTSLEWLFEAGDGIDKVADEGV